jgi:adenosine deaminase CECR1
VVLGADDPGTFGYDHVTIDWYEAFMAWGLTLKDLKKLSINALDYSAMNDDDKELAFDKWTPLWNGYISSTKLEACNITIATTVPTVINRILPRAGAVTGTTNVHVFGRHFERAICETVTCKFGQLAASVAYYVSNTQLICISPPGNGTEVNVNVSVSLDSGITYIDTGETFTYTYLPIQLPADEPITDNARHCYLCIHVLLIGIGLVAITVC